MEKRTSHNKLTLYRRHAGSCPVQTSTKLDQCECPLWCHGKLHGKFTRRALDTRSVITATLKVNDLIQASPDPPPEGGVPPGQNPGEIRLRDAAQEFFRSKRKRSTPTQEIYKRAIGEFVRYAEAHSLSLLSQIDTSHLHAYFADYDSDWKRNTAQGRLTYLRVFFNYCVSRRWIAYSPAADRDLNYGRSISQSKRLPFTPDEIAQILAAVERMPEEDRDRARALTLLLLFSGMRISDATFFERAFLTARHTADYYVIKTRRLISLPPEVQQPALDALAKLPASRVYFFQPDRPDDYAEARSALRDGQEFSSRMPDYRARVREAMALVEKVLSLAGIRRGREGGCHRFRDTFAVNLLSEGADVYTVSKMLGHSDVKITEKYLKLIPGYRERMSQSTRRLAYVFPDFPQAA
jgi:site-specific recombinase XerD